METDLIVADEYITSTATSTTTGEEYVYQCTTTDGAECASTCISLLQCQECNCAIIPVDGTGPWGDFMDVFFCLVPILFLIYVTMKTNPYPTTKSLPLSALLLFLIRLVYLGSDPILTCGSVVLGVLEAITPITIMAGAIILFETMEATYCLQYMMREMKVLTNGHKVAECMLIYAFAQMVEGASGFGTPAALGAPMLVSTGNPPLESVIVLLLMNTFTTLWGAVGTPIWFGFGSIGLSEDEFLEISKKAAIGLGLATFLLMPLVLCIIIPYPIVKQNIRFILAGLVVSTGPSIGIAFVNYKFPSLIGGICGCFGIAILIRYKIGLKEWEVPVEHELVFDHDDNNNDGVVDAETERKNEDTTIEIIPTNDENYLNNVQEIELLESEKVNGNDTTSNQSNTNTDEKIAVDDETTTKEDRNTTDVRDEATKTEDCTPTTSSTGRSVDEVLGPRKSISEGYLVEVILRTFPIWCVVLLLIVSRVEQIGLKGILQQRSPAWEVQLGTLGEFRLSVSLVVQLNNILTYPLLNWRYEILYVPFIIPFVIVSLLTMVLFRKNLQVGPKQIAMKVMGRLQKAAIALMGALVLVQLMIRTGTAAPAYLLGTIFSKWFQQGFVVVCPLLGVLGSFFSGSTTLSNLTFGGIQQIAAESIGISSTSMLALQAIGACAGNGVSLNNIISASVVVGLTGVGEIEILKKTFKIVFATTTIATILFVIAFFRF